jgi:cell division protein FtsI (penicillin-binding protein 3)
VGIFYQNFSKICFVYKIKVNMQENKMIRYRSAILLALFLGILILFAVFLINLAQKIGSSDELKSKIVKLENKAVRGKIISADNFVLAHSSKLFRAEVHTQSIDPKKKNLFIKLFSIYSGLSEKEVAAQFLTKSGHAKTGYIYLTDNLDYRLASDLKSLSYKMMKLKIFRPLNPRKAHIIHGLDIVASSEQRYFPHKNILTPVVGYVHKTEEKYKRVEGIKGLEKSYSSYLLAEKDGLIQGKSDSLRTPLRTGDSRETKRIDGLNLHLNMELSFQKKVKRL